MRLKNQTTVASYQALKAAYIHKLPLRVPFFVSLANFLPQHSTLVNSG